ncbi:hypothetical protein ABRY23_08190 [Melioribacteraceae bacterium 4301-Me]|uniref:hypothetical protein n=1 Tax=Pyranulibacter aquaticus TaxID=3163344 RepID=UPI0035963B15
MGKFIKTLIFASLLVLSGCYTQVALREPTDWNNGYANNENESEQYNDTTYSQDSSSYYNDYYDNYYNSPYRRYYYGYYPPSGFSLSLGYFDPWYYDYYNWWCGTCLTWGYYSPWYSPYYYSYYPYFYYGYYPYYYPTIIKYRNYNYTHLRDNSGGRGYSSRSSSTRDRFSGGRTPTSINNSTNNGKPSVDLTNTPVSRSDRNENGRVVPKSANPTSTRNNEPAVRERAPRSSEPRTRSSNGSRSGNRVRYIPRGEAQRNYSPPAYIPKSPQNDNSNGSRSYSPPSSSSPSSSRGTSSSGGNSTRNSGTRSGRR